MPLFKRFVLCLLCLLPLTASAQDPVAGFVDSRQLLLMHPLFRQFDPGSRRFLETSSAYVSDPEKAREAYQASAQTIEKQTQDLDRRLQQAMKEKNPQTRKQAIELIWRSKAELKVRLAELKKASEATKVQGNYLLGPVTGNESLIPLLKQILTDIQSSFRQLSLNNQGMPVFDLSVFSKVADREICDRSILFSNYHFALYGQNPDPVMLRQWLHQLRLYLRDRDPRRMGNPFLHGFKDLRNDSLKFLSFGTR